MPLSNHPNSPGGYTESSAYQSFLLHQQQEALHNIDKKVSLLESANDLRDAKIEENLKKISNIEQVLKTLDQKIDEIKAETQKKETFLSWFGKMLKSPNYFAVWFGGLTFFLVSLLFPGFIKLIINSLEHLIPEK